MRRGVSPAQLDQVSEEPGVGMRALWQGRSVQLRRPEGAASMGVALAMAGEPTRLIPLADRLREDTRAALAQLAQLGIPLSILSGDNPEAVAAVARETGLTGQANTSPADKQQAIARLQAAGYSVLMVGDGLNDGPALAAADASIAPGSASDVGMQAADFVFVQDTLVSIPRAIRAARRTMAVVKQNFVLAIGYNVLAVPLAVAGYVTPLVAALAMSLSSLIVVANSLRLVRAAK
jgi:Cu2+-exporting ATPase